MFGVVYKLQLPASGNDKCYRYNQLPENVGRRGKNGCDTTTVINGKNDISSNEYGAWS